MFASLFLWAITFGYGVGFSLDRAFNRLGHLDEAASAKANQSGTENGKDHYQSEILSLLISILIAGP